MHGLSLSSSLVLFLAVLVITGAFQPRKAATRRSTSKAELSLSSHERLEDYSDPKSARTGIMGGLKDGAVRLAQVISISTVLGSSRSAFAAAPTEDDFITSLATCLTSKRVLAPVKEFVTKQSYDSGRTNVNYLINFLQVQKAGELLVKSGLEFAENPDNIDNAVEASAQLSNTLIQLDSSIYTVIFIPGDESGKPPPAAEKYIKMIDGYYKDCIGRFDTLLSLAGEEQLKKATEKSNAQVKGLEMKSPFLFKMKDGPGGGGFDPKA